ncbi:hypothetical protein MPTK1_2g25460 [Marchantia polymorpha subsp. ruderalis]|uniref:Uncharacterized protein n=1 Tax=Marchantia polymorpha TaxID=3197 RepID=A0A2R6XBJ6_MARPO|nr:hypothetical protein MARPO_0025s0132 [Marchantia polymorpha]BBN03680.1 hypothetical protein Mp_2g25460 [Marchantia polymorpha subsp. ruderalis]|eukprot:PTQ43452.1 hypothetical protein MARPO_0025s0132 [Marchantia polymorpha]
MASRSRSSAHSHLALVITLWHDRARADCKARIQSPAAAAAAAAAVVLNQGSVLSARTRSDFLDCTSLATTRAERLGIVNPCVVPRRIRSDRLGVIGMASRGRLGFGGETRRTRTGAGLECMSRSRGAARPDAGNRMVASVLSAAAAAACLRGCQLYSPIARSDGREARGSGPESRGGVSRADERASERWCQQGTDAHGGDAQARSWRPRCSHQPSLGRVSSTAAPRQSAPAHRIRLAILASSYERQMVRRQLSATLLVTRTSPVGPIEPNSDPAQPNCSTFHPPPAPPTPSVQLARARPVGRQLYQIADDSGDGRVAHVAGHPSAPCAERGHPPSSMLHGTKE